MCILHNQRYHARPNLVNLNSCETLFYPLVVNVNKCDWRCNTIDDPCAQVCVPNKANKLYAKKKFNLISGVNKTRFSVQHE